jgi:hypothetical protein
MLIFCFLSFRVLGETMRACRNFVGKGTNIPTKLQFMRHVYSILARKLRKNFKSAAGQKIASGRILD